MILSNIRIVEFAQGVAGPLAACRLGDLGADVIKIEFAPGDWMRECPPFLKDQRTSASFFALNRGKRSLAFRNASTRTSELWRRLLMRADVFLTDRTQHELAGLGLQRVIESAAEANPGLLVVCISPFGHKGPLSSRPGSELCAQAMAGYTRYLGKHGEPARRLGADVAGVSTATFATQAILAALLHRLRTGRGQRIYLSLLNSLLSMKTVHLAAQSDPDHYAGPRVGGANDPPERGWATADSPITFSFGGSVGPEGRPGWVQFVQELGLDHLLDDPRFDKTGRSTTGLGPKARELKSEYEREFLKHPSAKIVETVRKYGGIASSYLTHDELLSHEQTRALQLVTEVPHKADQNVPILAFPGRFSRTKPELRGNAPEIGEHTRDIARELGFSDSQIDAFIRSGELTDSDQPESTPP